MSQLNLSACHLRAMVAEDLRTVLEWRNSDRIRQASFGDHLISWEEHVAWFSRSSEDEARHNYVFEYAGTPMGVVNMVLDEPVPSSGSWGFYIGESNAPQGVGRAMGFLALVQAFESLGMKRLIGEALATNKISCRFHRQLGFVSEGNPLGRVLKNGVPEDVEIFVLTSERWRSMKGDLEISIFRTGK